MHIDPGRKICTVIVTVDGDEDAMRFAAGHASAGLVRFRSYDGFLAGATHVSEDGTRMVQYLQWESREAHEACMGDPAWESDPSSRRFMELVGSGAMQWDVRIYGVAALEERDQGPA